MSGRLFLLRTRLLKRALTIFLFKILAELIASCEDYDSRSIYLLQNLTPLGIKKSPRSLEWIGAHLQRTLHTDID